MLPAKLAIILIMTGASSMVGVSARADDMSFTGSPAISATVGQAYRFVPSIRNGITAHLQFSYINKPAWSRNYRSSGAIIGTPTEAGVWNNIQIVASDGIHYAWSKPFTITVAPDQASTATISGTPAATATVGESYHFLPTVIAAANAKWTYAIRNKPAWATFNAQTGALSGTPTAAAAYDGIVISVSNGTSSAALPAFDIDVTDSSTGTANLTWVKPTPATTKSATTLTGYVIQYGTSIAALNKQLLVASSNASSAEIQHLSTGTWYFKVAAIGSSNVVGDFSGIVAAAIR